jgi:hypothetical protein
MGTTHTAARRALLLAMALITVLIVGACDVAAPVRANYGGRPVRWNPCGIIHYQIDPAGMPVGFSVDVHAAFDAASAATGVRHHYDGVYPHGRAHSDANDPVLVSYGTVGHGSTGYAEPTQVGGRYVGGTILLDGNLLRDRARHRRVAFHEVGHLFGLGHPPSALQSSMVMGNAALPYRAGDLAGFRAVGGQPGECH